METDPVTAVSFPTLTSFDRRVLPLFTVTLPADVLPIWPTVVRFQVAGFDGVILPVEVIAARALVLHATATAVASAME